MTRLAWSVMPDNKVLLAWRPADFMLRSQATSILVIAPLQGLVFRRKSFHSLSSHLPYTAANEVNVCASPLSDYRAASSLGDSLYYLHADPRTKLGRWRADDPRRQPRMGAGARARSFCGSSNRWLASDRLSGGS